MFRRREDGSEELINENETASQPGTPAQAAASAPAAAAAPTPIKPVSAPNTAAQPAQSAPSFRPVAPQAAMSAASRSAMPTAPVQPAAIAVEPSRAATPTSRPSAKRILTVGPDIQMKGEITSCDRVVIEGMVDATMRDVHTVELAETGSLKGTAEVEDAEISGAFEGDLVVRGKLTVYSSGRVRGNVTYGEIEIQRGGQISGNIRNAADAKADAQPQKKAA
jgi:cytoskeletal protein CcmA (bactofilin family)